MDDGEIRAVERSLLQSPIPALFYLEVAIDASALIRHWQGPLRLVRILQWHSYEVLGELFFVTGTRSASDPLSFSCDMLLLWGFSDVCMP